jgi:hypothetical protein
MVLIQFFMTDVTVAENIAAGRHALLQSALHGLAGRECSISIISIEARMSTNAAVNGIWRIDFPYIQPSNRAQIENLGTALDVSMSSYGFLFSNFTHGDTFDGLVTKHTYPVPPTFTAFMSEGNRLTIAINQAANSPSTLPPTSATTPLYHVLITLEVVPID